MKTIEDYYYHLDLQERNARGFEPGHPLLQSPMKPTRLSMLIYEDNKHLWGHQQFANWVTNILYFMFCYLCFIRGWKCRSKYRLPHWTFILKKYWKASWFLTSMLFYEESVLTRQFSHSRTTDPSVFLCIISRFHHSFLQIQGFEDIWSKIWKYNDWNSNILLSISINIAKYYS